MGASAPTTVVSTPFFIVSAGHSGAARMAKALATAEGVTIEHDYMAEHIRPLAVRRYQGLADERAAKATLAAAHGAALRSARTRLWGDSSNTLSWLIPELAELFPDARFIHVVRDGRKVARAYFHEPGEECYGDRSTGILADYLLGRTADPPPPERKYWWQQPKSGEPWAKEFARFNRFQRIVWHWSELNRVVLRDLKDVPEHRRLFVRFEDLRAQPSTVTSLLGFLGIPYRDALCSAFARPHNSSHPDIKPAPEQAAQFALLATPMMKRLGYGGQAE